MCKKSKNDRSQTFGPRHREHLTAEGIDKQQIDKAHRRLMEKFLLPALAMLLDWNIEWVAATPLALGTLVFSVSALYLLESLHKELSVLVEPSRFN